MEESNGRVLIVDDDPGIVAVVQAVLAEENYETFAALDGEEALEAVSTHRPDVILLDLMMPKVDGLEVCRRVRNNPSTSHMCVLMMTARTFPADRLVGLGVGADDYVTKPFDPTELPARIRAALRKNRETAALSPLTRLPGRRQMQEMQDHLLHEGSPFALMSIDLDDFSSFNERYGQLRGDMAIRLLAHCLQQVIAGAAGSRGFVGHLGGDEFVTIVDTPLAARAAEDLISMWERCVADVYDSKDAAAGFIEVIHGDSLKRVPLLSLSIGMAFAGGGGSEDGIGLLERAQEMRLEVKARPGSTFRQERDGAGTRMDRKKETEIADADRLPLLRKSRRGRPDGLWDQVATSAAERGGRPKDIWITDHPHTVVIVDDEQDIRDVLKLHCEMRGFPVVAEAEGGAEGVLRVGEHQPAFVILDYHMPGMDGEEAAARMRIAHPEVKIIAFSGVLTERPEWADDYLSKEQIAQITPLLGRFLDMGISPSRRPR